MGVAGMTIFEESKGNSDVAVTVNVAVGVGVSVDSGVGVDVGLDRVSEGVSVDNTLAAMAGVDEHPLLNITARARNITGRKFSDRNTAPVVVLTNKLKQFYHLVCVWIGFYPFLIVFNTAESKPPWR